MSISFGWPLALIALSAIPLLLVFGLRSRLMRSPARRRQIAFFRVLAVLATVLALAGMRVGFPTDELAVATVVDGSPRISDSERTAFNARIAAQAAADPETYATVAPSGDVTRDLQIAASSLPRDHVRRILLATDGRAPSPDLRVAIEAARQAGTEVFIAPLGDQPVVDTVSVSGVELPRLVRAGETIGVAVTLHASRDLSVPLALTLAGEGVAEESVDATAGSSTHTVAVEFPEHEGVYTLEVALGAGARGNRGNDRWRSLVRVVSRPRVLHIHTRATGEPALASVLRDAELNVQLTAPAGVPTDRSAFEPYSLVVLDETDPGALTEPQQQALRAWVEADGGGLITITGNHPVRREPQVLREIEPVRPPPAIPEPRPLELILVIDRSSSMSGGPMEQARRGGIAAVRSLRIDARVGVVAFSGAADHVQPVVGMDQADTVAGFIGSIHADGGTDIAAALRAANRLVSDDTRYIRHVVLLSDGESEASSALSAASTLAGRGVTISTITIGPFSQLMDAIAHVGHGRYHVTSDASSLPRLVVHEAQFRQPPAHRNVHFQPRVVSPLAMLDEVPFESAPEMSGYALAVAKPGAATVLGTPDDGALLAHWYRGLGQVATFASATDGGWADPWRAWDGFRTFWSALAWGMMRTRTVEPVQLHLGPSPREGYRLLTVVGETTSLTPEPIVLLHRGGTIAEGAAVPLRPRGPGVWQSDIALGTGILVTGRMPDDIEPTAAIGDEMPYDDEMRTFGLDEAGIASLAALGGGAVLEDSAAITDNVESQSAMREARTALLAFALAMYLLSLLVLRMPDKRRVLDAVPAAHAETPAAVKEAA